MKLKIDENLPAECAGILSRGRLRADTVADEGLTGADDAALAAKTRSEGRVLVTLDLDFANIRAYPPAEYAGIIVLRPKKQDKQSVLELVHRLALVLVNHPPTGELWMSKPIVFDFELNRAHVDLVTRNWKFRIASAHRNRIFLEKRQFAAGDQWTTRFSCNQQRFYRKNQKRFPATGCASRSGSAVPSSARAGFVTSRRCARSSPYFFAM